MKEQMSERKRKLIVANNALKCRREGECWQLLFRLLPKRKWKQVMRTVNLFHYPGHWATSTVERHVHHERIEEWGQGDEDHVEAVVCSWGKKRKVLNSPSTRIPTPLISSLIKDTFKYQKVTWKRSLSTFTKTFLKWCTIFIICVCCYVVCLWWDYV